MKYMLLLLQILIKIMYNRYEVIKMMKMAIKPVSALRDYNKLLKEVDQDNPVFLTKNGYGKYAIVDIEEYDRFVNGMKLLKALQEASVEDGLYTMDDVFGESNK